MKIFFTALLSFLTLIGGHFVNRRWDRAVLFLSLFFSYAAICFYMLMPYFSGDPQGILDAYSFVLNVFAAGTLVLLVVSSGVTVFDKMKPHTLSQVKFTLSGKIGASLLSVFSALLLLTFTSSYVAFINIASDLNATNTRSGKSSSGRSGWYDQQFNANLKFGEGDYLYNAKALPEGKGYMVGRIVHEGKPVVGVKLKLQFNDEFESKDILTDDDGHFVLRMPVGEWFVTRFEAKSWKNKPEGDFIILSGLEPKITKYSYSKYNLGESGGLEVNVTSVKPELPHMPLSIHPKIIFENKYKNRKPETLSFNNDKIEWPEYAGAKQYKVKVSQIKKDGSSTMYYPVSNKNVKNSTSIELKSLASSPVETDGDEKDISYNIKVFAFTDDGSYLSESNTYRNYTFKLKEPVKLIDNRFSDLRKGTKVGIDIKKRREYRKRFDAVELLIDEKIYDAANKLLQGDMAGSTPGKKEALWGYYYASQKQCKKAKVYFNKAHEIGGSACVINKHEMLCLSKGL